MIAEILEEATDYLHEHGHFIQGRNATYLGCPNDPAVCVMTAVVRVSTDRELGSIALTCAISDFIRVNLVAESIARWSDTTPDEEFFLTLKKLTERARELKL